MFGWGQLRQDHPADWKVMKDNNALQTPPTYEHLKVGKQKETLATEEKVPTPALENFRNAAMENYRSKVVPYLQNTERVKNDKVKQARDSGGNRETDEYNNPISAFDYKTKELWNKAVAKAKDATEKTMKQEKNEATQK